MKTTNVTSFKSRLSEYLGLVQKGHRILVTDHGKPVAEVQAPSALTRQRGREHLFRSGVLVPPAGKLDLAALDRIPLRRGDLTTAVLEEREGR